jgi:hypothetical protein
MTRVLCLLAVVLGLVQRAWAEEPPTGPTAEALRADFADLIGKLDDAEFAQRQDATRQLSEAGPAAFADLERAAAGGSREASARALDVFKGHFQRGDHEIKEAARQSLARLAQSKSSTLAQRAQNVLNPPKEPSLADANIFAGPNVRAINFQLQVARAAPARGGRLTSVTRDGNGKLKIEVTENGITTKIESVPGGKITAEISENGRVRTIVAKDLDDLRRQDGNLARLYEQFNQPMQLGAAFGPGMPPPGGLAQRPVALQQADLLQQIIKSIDTQIAGQQGRLPNNPAAQRAIDDLQRMKRVYEERLEKLPKPAEAPAAPPPAASPSPPPEAKAALR